MKTKTEQQAKKLIVGDVLGTWTVRNVVKTTLREYSIKRGRMINMICEVALIDNYRGQQRVLRTNCQFVNSSETTMGTFTSQNSYITWNMIKNEDF